MTYWFQLPPAQSRVQDHLRDGVAISVCNGSAINNPFRLFSSMSSEEMHKAYKEWLLTQPELLLLMRQILPGRPLTGLGLDEWEIAEVWLYNEIASGLWDQHIKPERIFVFGSNLAGRHGKGAALHARKYYGAEPGVGAGMTGHSYALPTKNADLTSRTLFEVLDAYADFFDFAASKPDIEFMFTRAGCGLAGLPESDLMEFAVKNAPSNVALPGTWQASRENIKPRVLITGSKTFFRYREFEEKMDTLLCRLGDIEIVSRGGQAIDQMAERYAVSHSCSIRRIPGFWHQFRQDAEMARDLRSTWYSTHMVAFWDGMSPGTETTIKVAKEGGLKGRIVSI